MTFLTKVIKDVHTGASSKEKPLRITYRGDSCSMRYQCTIVRKRKNGLNYKNTILLCLIVLLTSGCAKQKTTPDVSEELLIVDESILAESEPLETADSSDDEEVLFYQYFMEDGSLQLELYYNQSNRSGYGVRYYPEEEARAEESFTFQETALQDAILEIDEVSLCLDTYNIYADKEKYTGESMVQNFREEKEYAKDGRLDYYWSQGWIDWLDEEETDSTIIEIDWKYREDGTLQEKQYYRNDYLFGSWFHIQNSFYDKEERLAYTNMYITHGVIDVYYIYGEDETIPEYYFYIDHNLNMLDVGLVRYE